MKYFISLAIVLCAIAISYNQSVVTATGAVSSHKQTAVVTFKEPVKLLDVVLKGDYMFVHDDKRMAEGEACTYVFKVIGGTAVDLVCSFHCTPVDRPKAETFTMRSSLISAKSTLQEITEIQFAGSSEGHRVPAKAEARSAVVDLSCCP
jgi:hypothetical protein